GRCESRLTHLPELPPKCPLESASVRPRSQGSADGARNCRLVPGYADRITSSSASPTGSGVVHHHPCDGSSTISVSRRSAHRRRVTLSSSRNVFRRRPRQGSARARERGADERLLARSRSRRLVDGGGCVEALANEVHWQAWRIDILSLGCYLEGE